MHCGRSLQHAKLDEIQVSKILCTPRQAADLVGSKVPRTKTVLAVMFHMLRC